LISSLHFETTSIHVHKSPVECFEYRVGTPSTTTPLSRPLERGLYYTNALPFVSLTRPPRCQAKFLTCEISDFTPCTHAQSNILHTTCADKTDYQSLGIRV